MAKFEIGSLNPFENGLKEYYFNSDDLDDAKSAIKGFFDRKNVSERLNIFEGVTQYEGIVISEVKLLTSLALPNFNTSGEQEKISTTRFVMKIHVPALHQSIGNPCDVGDLKHLSSEEKKQVAINRIKNHPWFIGKARAELNGASPSFGSRVLVEFKKGPNSGRMVDGLYLGIVQQSSTNSLTDFCKENIVELFQNNVPTTLGGSKPS